MLLSLSVRDVVLIDRLDLGCAAGLSALTGETGAGKSILLDALGLALGMRADSALVRHGADLATVSAELATAPAAPSSTTSRSASPHYAGSARGWSRSSASSSSAACSTMRRIASCSIP